jgi:hypothetical protein
MSMSFLVCVLSASFILPIIRWFFMLILYGFIAILFVIKPILNGWEEIIIEVIVGDVMIADD